MGGAPYNPIWEFVYGLVLILAPVFILTWLSLALIVKSYADAKSQRKASLPDGLAAALQEVESWSKTASREERDRILDLLPFVVEQIQRLRKEAGRAAGAHEAEIFDAEDSGALRSAAGKIDSLLAAENGLSTAQRRTLIEAVGEIQAVLKNGIDPESQAAKRESVAEADRS